MAKEQRVSLSLKDMVAGGGGICPDGPYEVVGADFTIFDFNGKAEKKTCLHLTLSSLEEDRSEEQYYSAAKPTEFEPSDDGEGLVKAEGSSKTALNNATNYAFFLGKLEAAGHEGIDDSVSVLVGQKFNFKHYPAPDINGQKRERAGNDGKTYAVTIFAPESVIEEKKGKASAKSAAPKGASKKAAEETEDSGDVMTLCIGKALEKMAKGGPKTNLRVQFHTACMKEKVDAAERDAYIKNVIADNDALNEVLVNFGYAAEGDKIVKVA